MDSVLSGVLRLACACPARIWGDQTERGSLGAAALVKNKLLDLARIADRKGVGDGA